MKEIKNIIFVGYCPKTSNLISLNGYSFPLETGGLNKNLILDIDLLREYFKVSLLVFDMKGIKITSKGIDCTPLTFGGFIRYLLSPNNLELKAKSLFIVKGTVVLGLIIKLLSPFHKVIIVIERTYKYASWKEINLPKLLRPLYFVASFFSLLLSDRVIADRRDNWVLKTKISAIKNKSIFLPSAIDTKIYYPDSTKKIGTVKNLLYVGRLAHKEAKNPELLFKSFELIKKRVPNLFLTVIGGDRDDIPDIYIKEELLHKIKFIKNIPCNEVAEYYRNSDLTLLTSYHEGTPIVILESLACGTPCIITNVLEEDLIIEGENGYICKSFSELEFSDLVEKGLNLSETLKSKNKSLLNPVYKSENRNKLLLDLINDL